MAYDAGDVISRLLLDMTDFRRALKSAPGIAKKDLAKVEAGMRKTTKAMSKTEEAFVKGSEKRGKRFEKSWWKRYGSVAIGFTIVYRSMQVIQRGVEEIVSSFAKGIREIDEFRMSIVEVAASLQMLTDQPSTEGLKAYYAFASSVFEQLEMIAVKHISTGEDLRSAYAKLATMGIVPQTEVQLEQMARMVDLVLIQTRGLDKQRQIRTELQSFVKGEMRQGAVVARMMRERVEGYEELIKNIKEESDVAKKTEMIFAGTAKVLDSVGSVSDAIMNTHTAWLATLQAITNRIWRAGLFMMYEDLLDVMRKIYGVMIDQNQLTDTAIKLAFGYQVAWKSVKLILEGVYNSSVGIYTTWIGLTADLSIGVNLIKAFAMGVAIIKLGFQTSAVMLEYVVTRLKEWVSLQKDVPALRASMKHEELLKKRAATQDLILGLVAQRKKLEEDVIKGVENSKESLQAVLNIQKRSLDAYIKINLEIEKTEALLKPYTFTFDELMEKSKKLNEDLLITMTEIAELGTGFDLEKFKKELDARTAALKAFMKDTLDLQTGSLQATETIQKKFDRVWAKTMLDKYEYAKFLAQREYEEFAKYEDLKAMAAILLNERLKKTREQEFSDQLTAMQGMYKDMSNYSSDYFAIAGILIDQQADEYRKLLETVLGAKEAEVFAERWAAEEKEKLHKAHVKMVLEGTRTMADNWATFFKFVGEQNSGALEAAKIFAIAAATIDVIQTVQAAILWGMKYGGPTAPYLAAAAGAAAMMAGMANIAKIEATYAEGGWLKKHPGGGPIKEGSGTRDDVFLGATPGVLNWGMRDEYVFVLNKEATRRNKDLIESMNRGFQLGGRLETGPAGPVRPGPSPGYPNVKLWIKLRRKIEEVSFEIANMLGEITGLDKATISAHKQVDAWKKEIEDLGGSIDEIAAVEARREEIIAHIIGEMQKNFIEPLEDIIAEGVLTEYGYEMLQLGKWYEEQKKEAEELGLGLGTLNAAYAIQRQEIEATRKVIIEDITRRLGILKEAKTPGAGLTSAELAIFDLTKEFAAVIEEIQGWTAETGQNFDTLIADATELYELEMEAALAQSEAAQEIRDSISEWASVIESIDDTIYGLSISMASPASALERMGIVEGMIDAFPEVSTPEQAAELQGLWDDYLELAQDIYQRPSSEYQAIYDDMINALESIQDDAAGFIQVGEGDLAIITSVEGLGIDLQAIVTALEQGIPVDIALTIPDVSVTTTTSVTIDETILNRQTSLLEAINAAVSRTVSNLYSNTINTKSIAWALGGSGIDRVLGPYQAKYGGVFSGPESGYPGPTMHGVELITPLDKIGEFGKTEFNLSLTINGAESPRKIAIEVREEVEDFLLRGRGRKLMKNAAKGH